ncbi:MAG TPA: hypothetical protein VFD58_05150 [Blastocatellia bacterium]|nr:hypothetical protein [Blastocatellia bacterium]
MNWMNQLGGLLGQYSGVNPNQAPDTVYDDFDRFAQAAPPSALAEGLAEAFRSDQTPPFSNMLGQLFGQSSGYQRAGILNTLIATLGPTLVAQFLSQKGAGALAGQLSGGQREVTPQQAEQVPPDVVQEIAAHAEQTDPSVIDRLSSFYAQHPTLVKSLGAAALAVALSRFSQGQRSTGGGA